MFDQQKYDKIIKICCLEEDLNLFTNFDQTMVIENGANLSGGQKQRINLARCIYREAETYIFDDPLSEIDPKLGKIIFDQVFSNSNGYLKEKVVEILIV